ncbi:hypothetical protein BCEN4_960018 [Burkholderia cenocepacia]|nr:hypothetical protein BCEN4_960018 [Burkholderia cenocepacia]
MPPPVRRCAGARRAGGPALNLACRRPAPLRTGLDPAGAPPSSAGRASEIPPGVSLFG